MKYIKKFTESFVKNRYYEELPMDNLPYTKNRLKFTKIEIEKIKKNISFDFEDFSIMGAKSGSNNFIRIVCSEYEYEIDIDKYPDEWYYVIVELKEHTEFHSYKCDQLDGLLEFLKDFGKSIK